MGTRKLLVAIHLLVALGLAAVPALGIALPASAQAGGSYTVELTGDEISWSADWEESSEFSAVFGSEEYVALSGPSGIVQIEYSAASVTVGGGITEIASAIFPDFEEIEEGSVPTGGYTYGILPGETDLAIFALLEPVSGGSRWSMAISTVDGISAAVEDANATIDINGDPVFPGIETVTATSVETGGSSGQDEDETPEADDEDVTPEADGGETPEDEDSGDSGQSGDNTYIMELNGLEITWSDDWEFEESLNAADADTESVGFISGAAIQSILFLPTGVDLEQARDEFLEGFASDDVAIQSVDIGAYDNVSYSLDLAELDDMLWGLFTVYIDDGEYVRSFATLAPVDGLGDAVDLAADTITIDGEPIYNGVTGSGLQDLLGVAAEDFQPTDTVDADADETPEDSEEDEETPEVTAEDEETPEATEEDESASDDDNDDRKVSVGDDEEETPEATEEDDDASGSSDDEDSAVDSELADLGLVSDSEYESPQYGTTVEWDSTWRVWEDFEGGPVLSDTDSGTDSLYLYWDESDAGDGFASISINLQTAEGVTPADLETFWSSDEFMADTYTSDAELLGADSTASEVGVLVLEDPSGDPLYVYRGAVLTEDGETIVAYTLLSQEPVGESAFADAPDIEIDGEPLNILVDLEESLSEFT